MRNERIACTYIYEPASILTHGSLDLIDDCRAVFSTVLLGNQIWRVFACADWIDCPVVCAQIRLYGGRLGGAGRFSRGWLPAPGGRSRRPGVVGTPVQL